jgi:hypothetical protein
MKGLRMEARMRTSLRAFSCSFCDRLLIFTFFRAYTCESAMRCTLYTDE